MALWLNRLGAQVTGISLPPVTQPNLFDLLSITAIVDSQFCDVRDPVQLAAQIKQARPEVVFHLAAQALVRASYDDPLATFSTNVQGTVNVLDALRPLKSTRVVVAVTTDKVYSNLEQPFPYRETDALGGRDPYSASKACAELVVATHQNSFFDAKLNPGAAAIGSARAGNVIGGGDWAEDRLIPDILRAIQNGQSVNIRNPHATRPWQHVLEPLSGYLALAEKLSSEAGQQYAEGWNFGPRDEDARPVQWIVEQLTQSWSKDASWHLDGGTHPHEAHYLKLDCSKARATLGWQPRWDLGQALQSIIAWHKAHITLKGSQDMRTLCLQQINDYSTSI